mmetsp:Transcript_23901/g.68047  ORF Transcript_23901/g.68047 Transcript_23901/m.68047 type:complete len:99 (-) Transcript_23901:197-493(-)
MTERIWLEIMKGVGRILILKVGRCEQYGKCYSKAYHLFLLYCSLILLLLLCVGLVLRLVIFPCFCLCFVSVAVLHNSAPFSSNEKADTADVVSRDLRN